MAGTLVSLKMQNNPLAKIQSIISPLQEKVKDELSKIKEQFGSERSVIGIDVGTSSVKVVQMANVDGALTIIKSAFVDIGGVPGKQEEVLESLKTALIGIDTKGAKIVAIVNCLQTCTRKIIAPHMPKKELIQAVRWEAKNAIPFSIDEALMDFEVLGEISDKNIKKLIVAVAAAPKQTVDRLLSLFSKVDIEIAAMIPVSLSLQNLIACSKEEKKEIIAIVEMGASLTELNIYREGQMAFSRKLPVSGGDITKAMTSTLMSGQGKVELNVEEAEKIKKECGIPTGEETELVDGKILPSHILSLVRPCVEQLASEIERSFDFYREESHGGKVSKIILFGGGANLKGLVEALKNELEVDIEIGDALKRVQVLPKVVTAKDNAGSRFNLAIGAALNKGDKINLLPIELKEKTKRFVENVSLKGIVVGVVVCVFLFF
jgi:type IV pilus assembly protein PilM